MLNLLEFDQELRKTYPLICGVDEAGRGPLCGPVCCAAVILKDTFFNSEINDSKKLSEKKRNILYDIIIENSISYSITFIDESTIDTINILQASLLGMCNAVKQLCITPNIVLIDGNKIPHGIESFSKAIIKGDSTSMSIAAASILAKVSRDRYMLDIHRQYPQYCIDKHKGYPTKLHYEMLEKHGIQSFYRKTFLKNRSDLL